MLVWERTHDKHYFKFRLKISTSVWLWFSAPIWWPKQSTVFKRQTLNLTYLHYGNQTQEDEIHRESSVHRIHRNKYTVLVRKRKGKKLLGRPTRKRKGNIRRSLKKQVVRLWTWFKRLSGEIFHKKLRTSWLAERLLPSQIGLFTGELVS